MNYILFDDNSWENLLPLTFTRPVGEVRIGILTISEKWEKFLGSKPSYLTQEYLSCKYMLSVSSDNILINGSVLPTAELVREIQNLKVGQTLKKDNVIVAARLNADHIDEFKANQLEKFEACQTTVSLTKIDFPWHIFSFNEAALIDDFKLLTKGRQSAPISSTNRVLGAENIFIEEGASVEFAILNAQTGPIYVGKDAEIMEGAIVRGPLALCEHSALKMGAKIYGATTIGPNSKVGGEVSNSVIFGYSNKAHDGFLGNAVLGEWCNLGADTNNSNLKNNYAEVRIWNYAQERFVSTGTQFCGLIMGDHSKAGINTMFNTGTVVGVSANIFGAGFPRNLIPSFSWGGPQGCIVYTLNKAFETAALVMKRRGIELSDCDKTILTKVFEMTEKYRKF
ncbi:MAG: GlmU family protein [Bacteroidota bacterium]|nr:GlmU family protein [Bacteroidota bacterium]